MRFHGAARPSSLIPHLSSLLLLLLTFASCERRPLETEFTQGDYCDILLMSDWSLLGEVPSGMTAMFYPLDGGTPTSINSNNTHENVVRLKRGKYKIIVFNQSVYEFGSMNFSGMDAFETASASLVNLSPYNTVTASDYAWLATKVNSEDIEKGVREPEFFNADRIAYEVTDQMCRRQAELESAQNVQIWDLPEEKRYVDTIHTTPPPVPPTLHIRVRVKGIDNAYQVRAYISNLARSNFFGPHLSGEETAIQVLSSWKIIPDSLNKKFGEVTSQVRCFGVPNMQITTNDLYWTNDTRQAITPSSTRAGIEGFSGKIYLCMDFLLKDGKTHKEYEFDVSDDIDYDEGELVLNIDIEVAPDYPVDLPDVEDAIGSGGAGFDADVEDWEEEDHDINI